MSNVDVGQIRSVVQSLPSNQVVKIQAGTLLALVNLVKTLQGSEAVIPVATHPSDAPLYDLTRF